MHRKKKRKFLFRSGFTLVEVLMAFLILTIVLMGIMASMLISAGGISAARDKEKAMAIALSEIERLENLKFQKLVEDYKSLDVKTISPYTITAVVTRGGSLDINSLSADLTVAVSWAKGPASNDRHTLTLTREVSRYAGGNAGDAEDFKGDKVAIP